MCRRGLGGNGDSNRGSMPSALSSTIHMTRGRPHRHSRGAMREEPFGPLALINPVKSVEEAIEKANALPYGPAAYAFTRSVRNVDRLAEGVEAGNLSINHFVESIAETPFGGVKASGYGREGGTEGLECYTVVKNVSHLVHRFLETNHMKGTDHEGNTDRHPVLRYDSNFGNAVLVM